ncbi:ISWI chromatin-remodeling complex ATPase ISW2 [Mycena sanguinolenta]|uniref:ISWI chromatin-remodeling complex ATPase ISW2 n=1 Tax=Mycena sanguinolenta TaxID=230812 RepID=A0A8H6XAY6_9AGAR|nr:ISWI chromatin-remodeling complex ATPase ISW2 [Mycena sanguinolenta]
MAAAPAIASPVFYQRVSHIETPCPITKSEDGLGATVTAVAARQKVLSSAQKVEKRKRTDQDALECDNARGPKIKKEGHNGGQRSEVRADLEGKRKNWLFANRALFESLLPKNSTFITHLVEEMAGKATPPLPMRDFVVQPDLIVGGEMKGYQLVGLSYLAHMYHNGINCILGDEMGLGKTLQTLSLFAHIKETATSAMTHLIVCPLSVLSAWEAECKRWVPSMRVLRFHGSPDERERIKGLMRGSDAPAVDLVLTTYETLSGQDFGWFKTGGRWACVVLDEGHRIKNDTTDVASRAAALGGLWRLILTGTPVQNNLTELWGLLHWLYPQIFTPHTRALFASSFDLTAGTYVLPILNAVRTLLGTIQLRRTKNMLDSALLGGVPPKEEWTVFIPLTELQRFWTYRLLTRLDKVDLQTIFPQKKDEDAKQEKNEEDAKLNDGRAEMLKLLEDQAQGSHTAKQWQKFSMLLMQLRRICDHPYLIDDAQPEEYEIGEHIVAASSKMIAIDKILAEVLPKGERVLIFSQWTTMLDLVEDYMVLRNYSFLRLDGSVTRARREMVIRMFQREETSAVPSVLDFHEGWRTWQVPHFSFCQVVLSDLCVGINLTKASTCILCDSDWNPQNDLQAIARAHRIGQTKVVKIYRLICRASVEDQMLDRIRRKLFLAAKIIGAEGGGQNNDGPQGGSELLSILRRGSSALMHSDDGMDLQRFRSASLQEILDVSRTRDNVHDARVKHELNIKVEGGTAAEEALLRCAEEEERELLSGVAKVQTKLFEGTVLERAKAPKEAAKVETSRLRQRVDRTVSFGGMSFMLDDSILATLNGTIKPTAKQQKAKKPRFEWEDYCIACRDGGELVICTHCPRVFHAECHPTMTAAEVNRAMLISCSQHLCCRCSRSAPAAGGLLLRCQTCPQAFCTDCIDWDRITMVGDTIPEFVLRKFGKKDSISFIRCTDCCNHAKIEPEWAAEWESEIAEAQRQVDLM